MVTLGVSPNKMPQSRQFLPISIAICGVLFIAGGILAQRLGYLDSLGSSFLEGLIRLLTILRQAQSDQPYATLLMGFVLYAVATGLSFPASALLTIAYGWLFGFWPALILVSFASTAGAAMAFLLSRTLLRDRIQARFGDRLLKFNAALEREGAVYLFTLRMIPVVPFFVVNVVMGLTPISLRTFCWVSQFGMLAGTSVYVYAGTSLPNLEALQNPTVTKILNPQLLLAFAVLGTFPLVMKKAFRRFGGRL
jgi:uncharacterized membrane protein YdjX (TVP38/TMEM64 family)